MRPNHATIYRLGATIGLIGGATFVWANHGALPTLAARAAILVWVALFVLAVRNVWILSIHPRKMQAPRPRAGLVYTLACLGMLVLIMAGSRTLSVNDHEAAIPSLVAVAVGLHFLPFSRAFNAPFFLRFGAAMTVLGAAGLILALALGAPWGAGFAVLTGLTMTALLALDARTS